MNPYGAQATKPATAASPPPELTVSGFDTDGLFDTELLKQWLAGRTHVLVTSLKTGTTYRIIITQRVHDREFRATAQVYHKRVGPKWFNITLVPTPHRAHAIRVRPVG